MLGDKKGEVIPVTGCGGPQGCETSRLTHFLDNRLTDGDEVVSLMMRPSFTPRKFHTHIKQQEQISFVQIPHDSTLNVKAIC
jgi:hypothetical protein